MAPFYDVQAHPAARVSSEISRKTYETKDENINGRTSGVRHELYGNIQTYLPLLKEIKMKKRNSKAITQV